MRKISGFSLAMESLNNFALSAKRLKAVGAPLDFRCFRTERMRSTANPNFRSRWCTALGVALQNKVSKPVSYL